MNSAHVYGHQDRVKHALTLPEYLNTLADFIATNNTSIPIQLHPPNEDSVYINNQFIPNNYNKTFRKYCYRKEAVTYLQRKYKWSNETILAIHWKAHEENLTNLPYKKWKQRIKLIHNHLAFGKINFESSKQFPYYNENESSILGIEQDHFLCCNKSQQQQKIRITTITEQLRRIYTPPTIRKILVQILISFYETATMPQVPPHYQPFMHEQEKIGWRHFARGRISTKLVNIVADELHQHIIHQKYG